MRKLPGSFKFGLFALLVLILGIVTGNVFFNGEKSQQPGPNDSATSTPLTNEIKHELLQDTANIKTLQERSGVNEDDKASDSSLSQKEQQFQDLIKSNGLEKVYQDMATVFPETDVGQDLLKMATLIELEEQAGGPESKMVDAIKAKLQDRPEEVLNNLKTAFSNLPDKYSAEKQSLLQYASKIEASESARIDFLMNEAKRPIKYDENGRYEGVAKYNISTAFYAITNVVGMKEDQIEPLLRNLLEAQQQDPEAQRLLIHTFSRISQDRANEIRKEYSLDK